MVDVNRIGLEFYMSVERTKKLGEMWPCAAICPTRLCLPAYPRSIAHFIVCNYHIFFATSLDCIIFITNFKKARAMVLSFCDTVTL